MPEWAHDLLQGVGALADQAVVLPMLAAVALLLCVTGRRDGALAWAVAVSATLGVMLVFKLAVLTLAPLDSPLRSPSGHVAAGVIVYSGIVALLCRPDASRPVLALAAAASLAVVLGIARMSGGYHTAPEVVTGGLVGLAGLVLLLRLLRPLPRPAPALPLLLLVVVVASSCAGMKMPAEPMLHEISADLRGLLGRI